MRLNKAIDRAIECVRGSIKQVNFDANLFDKGLSDTPHAQKCSERRKMLLEVIQTLEDAMSDLNDSLIDEA